MGKIHRNAKMKKYLVLFYFLIFCYAESDSITQVETITEDENFTPATTIQRYELFRKSGLALIEDKKNGEYPYCIFYNSLTDREYPDFRALECHRTIVDGLNALKYFEYLDKKFLEKLNSIKQIEYEHQLQRSDDKFCIFYKNQRYSCYENMDDAEQDINLRHAHERYDQGWINNLKTFPFLTDEEYTTSVKFSQEFYFDDIRVKVENDSYTCEKKTTGTAISAYSNEIHPLGLYQEKFKDDLVIRGWTQRFGSDKNYLLNVDYNCFLKNTDVGFLLFGPIFYQNNQWWGFEYYNDDYYDKSEKQHYFAFMTYFVKRVSLGKDILINN